MSFDFSQSSGEFCNKETGKCLLGYSGYKGEKDETKSNRGPIPQGSYTVENTCGGYGERCNLIPDSSNNMHGRTSFQVHGDNGKGDKTASRGCIILDQTSRVDLKKGDRINVKK